MAAAANFGALFSGFAQGAQRGMQLGQQQAQLALQQKAQERADRLADLQEKQMKLSEAQANAAAERHSMEMFFRVLALPKSSRKAALALWGEKVFPGEKNPQFIGNINTFFDTIEKEDEQAVGAVVQMLQEMGLGDPKNFKLFAANFEDPMKAVETYVELHELKQKNKDRVINLGLTEAQTDAARASAAAANELALTRQADRAEKERQAAFERVAAERFGIVLPQAVGIQSSSAAPSMLNMTGGADQSGAPTGPLAAQARDLEGQMKADPRIAASAPGTPSATVATPDQKPDLVAGTRSMAEFFTSIGNVDKAAKYARLSKNLEPDARTKQINEMVADGMPRGLAVMVADGRVKMSPVDKFGVARAFDIATGKTLYFTRPQPDGEVAYDRPQENAKVNPRNVDDMYEAAINGESLGPASWVYGLIDGTVGALTGKAFFRDVGRKTQQMRMLREYIVNAMIKNEKFPQHEVERLQALLPTPAGFTENPELGAQSLVQLYDFFVNLRAENTKQMRSGNITQEEIGNLADLNSRVNIALSMLGEPMVGAKYNPARPQSSAERDLLKKGTWYLTSDGELVQKGGPSGGGGPLPAQGDLVRGRVYSLGDGRRGRWNGNVFEVVEE